MSNALATISSDILSCKANFNAVLSNNSINFEREAEFAIQIISGNDCLIKLAQSNRRAVIDAVTNIAAIGISLNPAKKQAYLVPRKNKICLDISYMGLIDLAVGGNGIMWAQAALVYQNDTYQVQGFDKPPIHTFDPFSKDRGAIIGTYAVVKTSSGDYLTSTMTIKEAYDIRDRSEAYKSVQAGKAKSCPWNTDEGEMIKKTIIKRGYKYWPRTPGLDAAVHYLNTDGGEGMSLESATPIDLLKMLDEVRMTKTDDDALAYWKANNAKLANRTADHAALKNAVMAHRTAMRQAQEDRTIDMQPPAQTAIPSELQGIVDDMTADGLEYCEQYFNGCSKATQEKLSPFMVAIKAKAQQNQEVTA